MKTTAQSLFKRDCKISDQFALAECAVVYPNHCLDLLKIVPDESLQLIVTSPPYNIGKE